MDASVKGSLAQINTVWCFFEHKGKKMSKKEVIAVLTYAKNKGYESTSQLKDDEIDNVLKTTKK